MLDSSRQLTIVAVQSIKVDPPTLYRCVPIVLSHCPALIRLIGVDWDHKTKTKGIYRIISPEHEGWSRNVDTELGNYDFLLGADVGVFFLEYICGHNPRHNFQIDHRHPEVQADILDWGKWILEVFPSRHRRLLELTEVGRRQVQEAFAWTLLSI